MIVARVASVFVLTMVGVVAAACSDAHIDLNTVGGTDDVQRVTDASAVLPQELPIFCPQQRPNENRPCESAGSTCEYGTSPDMQCNKTYACTFDPDTGQQSFWTERNTDACLAKACPAEPADIAALDNQPCALPDNTGDAADEIVCPMNNGICACTTGAGGTDVHERRWVCILPPAGGCPAHRPLAGAGCTGTLWCDYGSCKFKRGLLMQCKGSRWLTGGAPCN